jgi:hypothetical protein
MLWSRDYFNVFRNVMDNLSTISSEKPATNPPIRRRYLFIEILARDGTLKLDTLEQKLDYSTVLIRRGRALEAARFLDVVTGENKNAENFLLASQHATAYFLSADRGLERESGRLMKKALEKWPQSWEGLSEDQKELLKSFGILHAIDFDHYRKCEVLFQRLMENRLKEKSRQEKKETVEETVDPIFRDAKGDPIRFLNEKGEYEAGRIANADKEQMPREAVEYVQQLLLWMPGDDRLLWLLAETFNASAMEQTNPKEKNMAVWNAHKIFERLTNLKTPVKYGLKEIRKRSAVLEAHVNANPIDIAPPPPPEDPNDVKMTSREWWWRQTVVLIVGLAVGMFVIWQIQETRRRRQARAAAKS